MTSAYTPLLGLVLPVTGELSGTWGTVWNDSGTSLLDSAIAGTTTLSTDADVTLTTTTGAANTSREAILLCSGARTVLRTITAPAQSKIYTVINSTTGGFSVKVVGVGPTTGVTIVAGTSAQIAWNGSDFVLVSTLTSAGVLPTANGGTGLTSFTSGGVVYASSSSALTTGSALTFDGTNLGVGATSPALPIHIQKTSTAAEIRYQNTAATWDAGNTAAGAYEIFSAANTSIQFGLNSSEQMRLTSTGLGVGTSTVGARLTTQAAANSYVAGALQINSLSATYKSYITNVGGLLLLSNSSTVDQIILDSSGNLGLGVTPSAWGSTYRAMQIGNGGSIFGRTNVARQVGLSANLYNNGSGNLYIASEAASQYQQDAGAHYWFNAPSGTAGNAITFTQALTLDASGNLLAGVTSGSFHRFYKSSASDFAVQSANTSASAPYGHLITFTAAAPNDATSMFLRCDDTGQTGRIQLRSNGGIANYTANNVVLSDRREKTNFSPAKSYLDIICAIPVQTFNYIDQNLETDAGLSLGVVAQDVQSVAPEFVSESNWGTKDQPKMRLEIYQTDLQYALMKALQELKADFDVYKAAHP
jgi:hypothetical protein